MKRLKTLLAVILISTGMVYAQSNTAAVDQNGDNQTSNATQVGSTNDIDIDQLSDNTGPQNATALQTGAGNSATINQSQTGGGNTGTNNAYIEQLGDGNISTQTQVAPGYNGGQNVWGLQDGTANQLSQTISGGYTNSLRAEQYGTENIANQSANGPYADGNVYQDGTANVADQTLTGSNNGYGGAIMLINQLGTENYASQTFAGSGLGHSNNGEIYQDGFDNDAWQDGSGRNLNSVLNQTGDLNISMQTQSGNDHSSVVTQSGNSNQSTVTQSN